MLGFAERGRAPLLLTPVPAAAFAADAPPAAPPSTLLPAIAATPGSDCPADMTPGERSTVVAGCCQELRTAAREDPGDQRANPHEQNFSD